MADLNKNVVLMTALLVLVTAAGFAQSTSPGLLFVYAEDPSQVQVVGASGARDIPQLGDTIASGYTIATRNTSAEFQMSPNGSAIRLAPNTTFRVDSLIGNAGATVNGFSLQQGKFRMLAAKVASVAEGYVISTPTAVAGVRGTDFARRYDPAAGEDWICVISGDVQFRNPSGSQSVEVTGGTFVDVGSKFTVTPVPYQWVTNNFHDLEFAKVQAPR